MSKWIARGCSGLAGVVLSLYGCTQPPAVDEPAAINGSEAATVTIEEAATDPVRVGVLAIDSAVSVSERYGALMAYLSEVVGRPFELVILSQESQFTQGHLD